MAEDPRQGLRDEWRLRRFYRKIVKKRAKQDQRRWAKRAALSVGVVVSAISFGVTAVMTGEVALSVAVGIVSGPAAVWVGAYLLNLSLAPVRIWDEQRGLIAEQQTAAEREATLSELGRYLAEGRTLQSNLRYLNAETEDLGRGGVAYEQTKAGRDIHNWSGELQVFLEEEVGEPHSSLFLQDFNAVPPVPEDIRGQSPYDAWWRFVWHRSQRLERVMESLKE